jgi:anti-sigma-K factor RskA
VYVCVRMKTHKNLQAWLGEYLTDGTPSVAMNIRREDCCTVSTDDRAAPLPVQLQQLAENGLVENLVKKSKVQMEGVAETGVIISKYFNVWNTVEDTKPLSLGRCQVTDKCSMEGGNNDTDQRASRSYIQ